MKNNKGFATSFILFGLLILFLIVMGVLMFTLGNSSALNSKIKNKLKGDIENPNVYNEYNFYYNGDVQVFTAPKSRTYGILAWSSSGNYISGKIFLKKGTKLYIYIGKTNVYNGGNTDIRTSYGNVTETSSNIMRAGYNSADSSVAPNKFTDVLKNNTTPSPGISGEGHVRIYYYSIKASNISIDPNGTGIADTTIRNKYKAEKCEDVQCILDAIYKKVKK